MVRITTCESCGSQALSVTNFDLNAGWLEGRVKHTVSPECVNVTFCSSCTWARRDGV